MRVGEHTHRKDFDRIILRLRTLNDKAYLVSWRVMNAEHHGIPQHRERVYIVGVRKDVQVRTKPYIWPKGIKPKC